MTLIRSALIVALAAAAVACNKSDTDRASQTTTTKATTTPTSNVGVDKGMNVQGGDANRYQLATARIAGARCDREVSCEQIGIDKRFSSRDVCAREEVQRTQGDLKSTDCPNGIDNSKLQSCLSALAQQDCSSLVTSLQTVDQCKTAALCIAP